MSLFVPYVMIPVTQKASHHRVNMRDLGMPGWPGSQPGLASGWLLLQISPMTMYGRMKLAKGMYHHMTLAIGLYFRFSMPRGRRFIEHLTCHIRNVTTARVAITIPISRMGKIAKIISPTMRARVADIAATLGDLYSLRGPICWTFGVPLGVGFDE